MSGDQEPGSIPVGQDLLNQMRSAFRDVFGRAPRRSDRMLLAGYRHSKRDIDRAQRKAFDLAGSPKHLVYATEKTGRFVTERNRNFLTKDDIAEWDEAAQEYLEAEAEGYDLLEIPDSRLNRAITNLRQCVDDAVVHLGSYIDRAPRLANKDLSVFCSQLLLTKCYWHLKCISDKWDEITTIEACALTRSLYECTLMIGGVAIDPAFAKVLEAQAFAGSPTFPYRTKRDGSEDYSTILSAASGETFPARTSFKRCADIMGPSHADFYGVLYPTLSGQVHFDLRHMMETYISSGSFLMWDDVDEITTSMLSGVTLIYLFSAILFLSGLQKLIKRDAVFMGQRIADAMDEIIESLREEELGNEKFAVILDYLEKVCW